MLNLNKAQVLGNLTRDPEMRFTPNGQAVLNITVATNRRWTGQDGQPGEATEYHDIVVWGKQAENINPMLSKGGPVLVEGRLQTRSWEGQDGVKRYKTEIVADLVIVLSSRSSSTPDSSNPVQEIADTSKNESKDAPASTPKEKKNEASPSTKATEDLEEIDIEDIPF